MCQKYVEWPKVRGMLTYGLGPALGLLSGPILARSLGPEGRGQLASIMEPLTLAGAVACLGVPTALAFFISRGYERRTVLKLGLMIVLPCSIVSFALLVLYASQVSETQNVSFMLLVVLWSTIFLSAGIQVLRGYWQGLGSWRRLDHERFTFALLRFAAILTLAALGFSSASVFASGSLIAFVIAGCLLLPSRVHVSAGNRELPMRRDFVRYSMLTAIGTIAVVGNNRLDQVLLPLVASSSQVGFYAVAVTIAEVPVIFATLAARNALTLAGGGAGLRSILVECRLFSIICSASCIGLAILAPWYTTLLFGEDFGASVRVLQILLVGTLFSQLTFVGIAVMSGRGMAARSSVIPAIGLITTIVGFWVYAPSMDSTTAAFVAAAGNALAGLTATWLIIRTEQLRQRQGALKAAAGQSVARSPTGTKDG